MCTQAPAPGHIMCTQAPRLSSQGGGAWVHIVYPGAGAWVHIVYPGAGAWVHIYVPRRRRLGTHFGSLSTEQSVLIGRMMRPGTVNQCSPTRQGTTIHDTLTRRGTSFF